MNIATFRTECFNDGERAIKLIESMGLTLANKKTIQDTNFSSWEMMKFSIIVPEDQSIEDISTRMLELSMIDEQFSDLHRCAQTLKLGEEPSW